MSHSNGFRRLSFIFAVATVMLPWCVAVDGSIWGITKFPLVATTASIRVIHQSSRGTGFLHRDNLITQMRGGSTGKYKCCKLTKVVLRKNFQLQQYIIFLSISIVTIIDVRQKPNPSPIRNPKRKRKGAKSTLPLMKRLHQ